MHLLSQNIGRMLLLAAEGELISNGAVGLPAALRRFGIELIWRPIRSRPPAELTYEIVRWVREPPYRASVAVTATTFKGRAATVAACALDQGGTGTNEAVARVRAVAGAEALRSSHLGAISDYARYWRSLPHPSESVFRVIRNRDLRREMVPHPFAPWFPDLNEFAITINAYERGHSMDSLGRLMSSMREHFERDGALPMTTSLADARATLFALQRAFHHEGDGPEPHDMPFVWAIVEAIYRIVAGKG